MFYVFIRISWTALQLFETKSIQRSNDMKSHEDFHSWTKNEANKKKWSFYMNKRKTKQKDKGEKWSKRAKKWTLLALLETLHLKAGTFISEIFQCVNNRLAVLYRKRIYQERKKKPTNSKTSREKSTTRTCYNYYK